MLLGAALAGSLALGAGPGGAGVSIPAPVAALAVFTGRVPPEGSANPVPAVVLGPPGNMELPPGGVPSRVSLAVPAGVAAEVADYFVPLPSGVWIQLLAPRGLAGQIRIRPEGAESVFLNGQGFSLQLLLAGRSVVHAAQITADLFPQAADFLGHATAAGGRRVGLTASGRRVFVTASAAKSHSMPTRAGEDPESTDSGSTARTISP